MFMIFVPSTVEVVVNLLVLVLVLVLVLIFLIFLATCGYSSCPCAHRKLESALGDYRHFHDPLTCCGERKWQFIK